MVSVLHRILHQLPSRGGSQDSGVVFLFKHASLIADSDPVTVNLFLHVRSVTAAIVGQEQPPIVQPVGIDLDVAAVHDEDKHSQGLSGYLESILDAAVNQFNVHNVQQRISREDLTPFQGVQEFRHAGSEHRVCHIQGPTHHPKHDVRLLCLHPLSDEVVQPPRVDIVVLEALGLQKVNEILHSGPEVTPDGQFLQSHYHVRNGLFTVLAPGEAVPKLGIGELVQAPSSGHAEVTPHVLVAAEVQLLHCPRAWLKALIWVFAGDPGCNDVASGNGRAQGGFKRNGGHSPGGLSVQKPYVLQSVQGHAHGDLQLRSRQVDICDHFSARMLHLQAWVQLQEVEAAILAV